MENVGDVFGFVKKLLYEEGKLFVCFISMMIKVWRVWMGNCKFEYFLKLLWCMYGLNLRWFDLIDFCLFLGKYL